MISRVGNSQNRLSTVNSVTLITCEGPAAHPKPTLRSSSSHTAPIFVQKALSPSPSTTHTPGGQVLFCVRFMFESLVGFFGHVPRPVGSFNGRSGRGASGRRLECLAPLHC